MAVSLSEREGRLRSVDGLQLYWRAWSPPAPKLTLAVTHGYFEHSGRYRALAEGMAGFGVATYAVDLRGHGQSEGARGHVDRWSQWVDDVGTFVDFVGDESAVEVVPLGHSVGGAVLLSAVLAGRVKPRRLVACSPALRPALPVPAVKAGAAVLLSRVLPRLALDAGLDPGGISRRPEVVTAYAEDPLVFRKMTARTYTEWVANREAVLRDAGRIGVPFLASHGDADPIIAMAGTVELCERAAAARPELKIYPGARHEPHNDLGAEQVFADLASWLERTS